MTDQNADLFRPEETCEAVAHAQRAALLIDAKAYFEAAREAMLKAERSILMIGWDFDSRTDLAPHLADEKGNAPDGAPTKLRPLLDYISRKKPRIEIKLLLWDFTMLYAADREPLPQVNLDWSTPPQVEVCLDDVLPVGASHHQKLLTVDDAVAFSGGIDITAARWDTPEHAPDESLRETPGGEAYDAFHDIQMVVDGAAARALAKVAHNRWHEASCAPKRKISPQGDPWPDVVTPMWRNIEVAISLTVPALHERNEVRQIERLYVEAIKRAEQTLYIENQYFTAPVIADALAERMKAKPDLDVVLITPKTSKGWLEAKSMGVGRFLFRRRLEQIGVWDRITMVYPEVYDAARRGHPVNVHAKLMIVDDVILTVGSANLNNRSMGFDTEANVTLQGHDEDARRAIARQRDVLVAEHLGLPRDTVAEAREGGQPLSALIRDHGERAAHDKSLKKALLPVDDAKAFEADAVGQLLTRAADPERPLDMGDLGLVQYEPTPAMRPKARKLWLAVIAAMLIGLGLLWTNSPLSQFTDIERLRPVFSSMQGTGWAALLVVAAYVFAGLAVFPVTVLITLTALVFPPVAAFFYAVLGVVASAAVTYMMGWLGGRGFLRRIMGRRLNAISRHMGRRGVIAVVALRAAPVAPFSLVNFVAGASHIRLSDFLIGTAVGMAPGIAVLSVMGEGLWGLLTDPTPGQVALVIGIVVVWFALGLAFQRLVDRMGQDRE